VIPVELPENCHTQGQRFSFSNPLPGDNSQTRGSRQSLDWVLDNGTCIEIKGLTSGAWQRRGDMPSPHCLPLLCVQLNVEEDLHQSQPHTGLPGSLRDYMELCPTFICIALWNERKINFCHVKPFQHGGYLLYQLPYNNNTPKWSKFFIQMLHSLHMLKRPMFLNAEKKWTTNLRSDEAQAGARHFIPGL
jgi:hypothetical protein